MKLTLHALNHVHEDSNLVYCVHHLYFIVKHTIIYSGRNNKNSFMWQITQNLDELQTTVLVC